MESNSTESETFHDRATKITVTRYILHHVKTWRTVNKMSNFQFGEWIQLGDYVTDLCDAGLIRHFGGSQYSLTMKGLRFLDALEQTEQTVGQTLGSAANPFPEVA